MITTTSSTSTRAERRSIDKSRRSSFAFNSQHLGVENLNEPSTRSLPSVAIIDPPPGGDELGHSEFPVVVPVTSSTPPRSHLTNLNDSPQVSLGSGEAKRKSSGFFLGGAQPQHVAASHQTQSRQGSTFEMLTQGASLALDVGIAEPVMPKALLLAQGVYRQICEHIDPNHRDWNEDFQSLWEVQCRPLWDLDSRKQLDQLLNDFDTLAEELATVLHSEEFAAAQAEKNSRQQSKSPPRSQQQSISSSSASHRINMIKPLKHFPDCFRYGNIFLRKWKIPQVGKICQRGFRMMLEARVPHLCFPLTSTHSFLGSVVTAMALIPLCKNSRVVYRGDGFPDGTNLCRPVHHYSVRLLEALNLCPHDRGSQWKQIGLEILEGSDTRFYVTNGSGLQPPLYPSAVHIGPTVRLEHMQLSNEPAHFMLGATVERYRGAIASICDELPDLCTGGTHNAGDFQRTAKGAGSLANNQDALHRRHTRFVKLLHSRGVNIALLGRVLLFWLTNDHPNDMLDDAETMDLVTRTICIEIIARTIKSIVSDEMKGEGVLLTVESANTFLARAVGALATESLTTYGDQNNSGVPKPQPAPTPPPLTLGISAKVLDATCSEESTHPSRFEDGLMPILAEKFQVTDGRLVAQLRLVYQTQTISITKRLCELLGLSMHRGGIIGISCLASDHNFSVALSTSKEMERTRMMLDEAFDGDHSEETLISYVFPIRASVHCRTGAYDKALNLARRVASKRSRAGNRNFLYLDSLLDTALISTRFGDEEAADGLLQRANEGIEKLAGNCRESEAIHLLRLRFLLHIQIGQFKLGQERPREAKKRFGEALELTKKFPEEFSVASMVFVALHGLIEVSGKTGQTQELSALHPQATLMVMRSTPCPRSYDVMRFLGLTLFDNSLFQLAAESFRDAMEICNTVYGNLSLPLATITTHLAFVYFKWNIKRYASSCEELLLDSVRIMRNVTGAYSVPHLTALHNWIRTLIEIGHYSRASAQLHRILNLPSRLIHHVKQHTIMTQLLATREDLREKFRENAILMLQNAWRSYKSKVLLRAIVDSQVFILQAVGRGFRTRRRLGIFAASDFASGAYAPSRANFASGFFPSIGGSTALSATRSVVLRDDSSSAFRGTLLYSDGTTTFLGRGSREDNPYVLGFAKDLVSVSATLPSNLTTSEKRKLGERMRDWNGLFQTLLDEYKTSFDKRSLESCLSRIGKLRTEFQEVVSRYAQLIEDTPAKALKIEKSSTCFQFENIVISKWPRDSVTPFAQYELRRRILHAGFPGITVPLSTVVTWEGASYAYFAQALIPVPRCNVQYLRHDDLRTVVLSRRGMLHKCFLDSLMEQCMTPGLGSYFSNNTNVGITVSNSPPPNTTTSNQHMMGSSMLGVSPNALFARASAAMSNSNFAVAGEGGGPLAAAGSPSPPHHTNSNPNLTAISSSGSGTTSGTVVVQSDESSDPRGIEVLCGTDDRWYVVNALGFAPDCMFIMESFDGKDKTLNEVSTKILPPPRPSVFERARQMCVEGNFAAALQLTEEIAVTGQKKLKERGVTDTQRRQELMLDSILAGLVQRGSGQLKEAANTFRTVALSLDDRELCVARASEMWYLCGSAKLTAKEMLEAAAMFMRSVYTLLRSPFSMRLSGMMVRSLIGLLQAHIANHMEGNPALPLDATITPHFLQQRIERTRPSENACKLAELASRLYETKGQYDDAIMFAKEMLQITGALWKERSVPYAKALEWVGLMCHRRSLHPQDTHDALEYLGQGIGVLKRIAPLSTDLGLLHNSIGSVYLRVFNLTAAAMHFRHAQAVLGPRLSRDSDVILSLKANMTNLEMKLKTRAVVRIQALFRGWLTRCLAERQMRAENPQQYQALVVQRLTQRRKQLCILEGSQRVMMADEEDTKLEMQSVVMKERARRNTVRRQTRDFVEAALAAKRTLGAQEGIVALETLSREFLEGRDKIIRIHHCFHSVLVGHKRMQQLLLRESRLFRSMIRMQKLHDVECYLRNRLYDRMQTWFGQVIEWCEGDRRLALRKSAQREKFMIGAAFAEGANQLMGYTALLKERLHTADTILANIDVLAGMESEGRRSIGNSQAAIFRKIIEVFQRGVPSEGRRSNNASRASTNSVTTLLPTCHLPTQEGHEAVEIAADAGSFQGSPSSAKDGLKDSADFNTSDLFSDNDGDKTSPRPVVASAHDDCISGGETAPEANLIEAESLSSVPTSLLFRNSGGESFDGGNGPSGPLKRSSVEAPQVAGLIATVELHSSSHSSLGAPPILFITNSNMPSPSGSAIGRMQWQGNKVVASSPHHRSSSLASTPRHIDDVDDDDIDPFAGSAIKGGEAASSSRRAVVEGNSSGSSSRGTQRPTGSDAPLRGLASQETPGSIVIPPLPPSSSPWDQSLKMAGSQSRGKRSPADGSLSPRGLAPLSARPSLTLDTGMQRSPLSTLGFPPNSGASAEGSNSNSASHTEDPREDDSDDKGMMPLRISTRRASLQGNLGDSTLSTSNNNNNNNSSRSTRKRSHKNAASPRNQSLRDSRGSSPRASSPSSKSRSPSGQKQKQLRNNSPRVKSPKGDTSPSSESMPAPLRSIEGKTTRSNDVLSQLLSRSTQASMTLAYASGVDSPSSHSALLPSTRSDANDCSGRSFHDVPPGARRLSSPGLLPLPMPQVLLSPQSDIGGFSPRNHSALSHLSASSPKQQLTLMTVSEHNRGTTRVQAQAVPATTTYLGAEDDDTSVGSTSVNSMAASLQRRFQLLTEDDDGPIIKQRVQPLRHHVVESPQHSSSLLTETAPLSAGGGHLTPSELIHDELVQRQLIEVGASRDLVELDGIRKQIFSEVATRALLDHAPAEWEADRKVTDKSDLHRTRGRRRAPDKGAKHGVSPEKVLPTPPTPTTTGDRPSTAAPRRVAQKKSKSRSRSRGMSNRTSTPAADEPSAQPDAPQPGKVGKRQKLVLSLEGGNRDAILTEEKAARAEVMSLAKNAFGDLWRPSRPQTSLSKGGRTPTPSKASTHRQAPTPSPYVAQPSPSPNNNRRYNDGADPMMESSKSTLLAQALSAQQHRVRDVMGSQGRNNTLNGEKLLSGTEALAAMLMNKRGGTTNIKGTPHSTRQAISR